MSGETKTRGKKVTERWHALLGEFRPPRKRQPVGNGLSYAYIAWDDLSEVLRPLLVRHGLVLFAEVENSSVDVLSETNRGLRVAAHVELKVGLATADGADKLECRWAGYAIDSGLGDKAIQKAVTSGIKYWLLKMLCCGEPMEDEDGRVGDDSPVVAQQPEQDTTDLFDLQNRAIRLKLWPEVKARIQAAGGGTLASLSAEELAEVRQMVEDAERANAVRHAVVTDLGGKEIKDE